MIFIQEMQQREAIFRRFNMILIPIYAFIAILAIRSGIALQDTYSVLQASLALALLLAPSLTSLIIRRPITQDCRMLYYLFVLCTVVVGSAFYGYSRIPYWDKIFHFLSGILLSAVGFIACQLLFHKLQGPNIIRHRYFYFFVFLWNMTVAVLWELYEYALFVFLDIDAVNHNTTGVHDTLQDMFVCMIGGLLFLLLMRRYFKKGKRSFLINTCFHLLATWEKPTL